MVFSRKTQGRNDALGLAYAGYLLLYAIVVWVLVFVFPKLGLNLGFGIIFLIVTIYLMWELSIFVRWWRK